MPLVSTIIPTSRRPDLLIRAIRSACSQTIEDHEVIVVIDGPNPETVAALRDFAADVRVIHMENAVGPGMARNQGAAASRAPWLAFLDDDDEWLPNKLERQLAVAGNCDQDIVMTCLNYVVTSTARYIWPRQIYNNEIPLDKYLFDRRSLFKGASFIPTPSLLLPRLLFDRFKFLPTRDHEDWDLLLRLDKIGHARILTVSEPLVVIHWEEDRESLSDSSKWKSSMNWIERYPTLVSRRAYSGFCLTIAGPEAARSGEWSAFCWLLFRAFRHGAPRPLHVAFFFAAWIIPMNLRRYFRNLRYSLPRKIKSPRAL